MHASLSERAYLDTLLPQGTHLEGAHLSGQLDAGLLKACLRQRFVNPGKDDIEVVYTFPLPFLARITEVSATLGDKELRGVVKASGEAERDYEGAVAAGDSAVLIEVTGDGVYTVNLGNLRPGEHLTVRMHFVQIVDWYQNCARLMFPTTIAPRYGDPQAQGGLPAHADTGTSGTVQHGFALDLLLRGSMAKAAVESPSHAITTMVEHNGSLRIQLADRAFLDRDFVLRLEGLRVPEGEVFVEDREDTHYALATFYPPMPGQAQASAPATPAATAGGSSPPWPYPLRLKLLVDCSGSMEGDSIRSAREAIRALLDGLSSRDRIGVARFGSSLQHVLEEPQAAGPSTRKTLNRWLKGLEADLGGTEMEEALAGLFTTSPGEDPYDVLLITDGEIWDISATVTGALKSGHRIFAIGVGSAPGESLLRQLADKSGGAALFVTPSENMTEAVHRLARMMSGPRISGVEVTWDCDPAARALVSENLYAGIPFRAAAMFQGPVDSGRVQRVSLHYRIGNTTYSLTTSRAVEVSDLGIGPVVAEACLKHQPEDMRTAFAERHQLLTKGTAWILVHLREDMEKAGALPALVKVPSMHAVGSHGHGSVSAQGQTLFCRVLDPSSAVLSYAASTADAPPDPHTLQRLGPTWGTQQVADQGGISPTMARSGTHGTVGTRILSELLGRLQREADLVTMWQWVRDLEIPTLDAQPWLALPHRLHGEQLVALLMLVLLEAGGEPRPSRQQLRILNFALRALSTAQITAGKEIMRDAFAMVSTTEPG